MKTFNKYSRRYICSNCGNKGRSSRAKANAGQIICPNCKTLNYAVPINWIKLIENQIDAPPEIQELINNNFFKLI